MSYSFEQNIETSLFFLIEKAATHLPSDILEAMEHAKKQEEKNSNAEFSLQTLSQNIHKASAEKVPMCQDTGFPTFYVTHSPEFSQQKIRTAIHSSVQKATHAGLLRPNAVDSLTGKNSGDNTGIAIPKIVFHLNEEKTNLLEIELLLKGGGSENVSDQYALPAQTDFGRAGRNLEGVKKAVLQTIKNAEGKGCAPGILGIHIGGDRATGYEKAKLNFLQPLNAPNPDASLDALQNEIFSEGNQLGIGPMGFGGKSTILHARVSASHRIPACFFVTIAYSCWALRRGKITCTLSGNISEHSWDVPLLEGESSEGAGGAVSSKKQETTPPQSPSKKGRKNSTKKLTFPLSESDIESLHVGDRLLLSGTIYTGRDTLHHYVVEEKKPLPKNISGSAIYHCGPVMKKDNQGQWQVIAAGPTTSIREEPYQAEFLEKTGVRAIIGKGGMGAQTLAALHKSKAVYLHAIGGAAAIYAEKITQVKGVDFLEEFGIPEAMWELEICDFPVIVTMDAHEKTLDIS